MKVKISDIVEYMNVQDELSQPFFNLKTYEIHIIFDDMLTAAEEEKDLSEEPEWYVSSIGTARDILFGDDWISLPSKWDIHEYSIMERFCLYKVDDKLSDEMYYTIKGSGAFRRFKEALDKYNLHDDWYNYKSLRFKEIAIEWCEANNISYEDDL